MPLVENKAGIAREKIQRAKAADASRLERTNKELVGGQVQPKRQPPEARDYAENIVSTIREPLLVLDADLRIITANKSFYRVFSVTPPEIEGKLIYEVGGGEWNIPQLRDLLENILHKNDSFENYEVDHQFPHRHRRIMLLNARRIYDRGSRKRKILLAIEDITERKEAEEENRKLFQKIELLSITDPLTGLYNRRYFESLAERELRLARRHCLPLSVMILDIDHFKNVNDTYGHSAGDRVLMEVAGALKGTLRTTDIGVRYGGDEFAFLCPNTDAAGALILAERLRAKISEATFGVKDNSLTITVSIGISELGKRDQTIETLLKHADQALYKAKNGGRDRSEIWKRKRGGLSGGQE